MGWKKRLRKEEKELGEKITKLMAFMSSPDYNRLLKTEQRRLKMQGLAMTMYLGVLEERITAFKETEQGRSEIERIVDEYLDEPECDPDGEVECVMMDDNGDSPGAKRPLTSRVVARVMGFVFLAIVFVWIGFVWGLWFNQMWQG